MSIEIAFLYYVLGVIFLSAKICFKSQSFAEVVLESGKDLSNTNLAAGMIIGFQLSVILWPIALVTTVIKSIRNK
jgi:hypothetical protein